MIIIITILAILALITLLVIFRKKLSHRVNYDTIFTTGLMFFAIGAISDSIVFLISGVLFIAMGLNQNEKK